MDGKFQMLPEEKRNDELKKRWQYNMYPSCKWDVYATEIKLKIDELRNRLSLEEKNILHARWYAFGEK